MSLCWTVRSIACVKLLAASFSSSAAISSNCINSFKPSFDPYAYTSGRWLHRDEERRQRRHVSFDFDALMNHVIGCSPTASRVVGCTKLEGGFNRVFMMTLDNGEEFVARLPTRRAGQPSIAMASGVATLDYVAQTTNLPVPKVLRWAGTKSNPIRTEYMMTTKLPGVPLGELWPQLSSYQHICCIESLNVVLQRLTKPWFPAYGSLYHSSLLPDKYPCVLLPDEPTFCIGPHCGMSFWASPAQELSENDTSARLGPFESLPKYIAGLFKAGYRQVQQSSAEQGVKRQSYEGSKEEVEVLLGKSHDVMEQVLNQSFIRELSIPTLMHPDLNLRNILVNPEDPKQVTGLLDWQSACIEPAFVWAADRPDFAKQMPDDPDIDESKPPSQPQKKREKDMSLCSQAWTACTLGNRKITFAARVDALFTPISHLTSFNHLETDGNLQSMA
ncbi:Hypothetical protein R9X50_00206600 [Acrodontium crateriforme]|uniref:Altered inheritance of mitochondria protein 9, mitochondrial n=1 Tax=Acrodontium crateriforme TaxID=150365 RepID=A0AAQ3R380_9PEZI|nr:Hypothetical protein R9X50_00206600 [Acrodontium crateriforme]